MNVPSLEELISSANKLRSVALMLEHRSSRASSDEIRMIRELVAQIDAIEELAEQAAQRLMDYFPVSIRISPSQRDEFVGFIRGGMEAATQAQREQLETMTVRWNSALKGEQENLEACRRAEQQLEQLRAERNRQDLKLCELIECIREHEQQLSHVTQDTRALMLKAYSTGHYDRLPDGPGVVDRLLAEHKVQQSCATPTKSSPPANAVDAPSSVGE